MGRSVSRRVTPSKSPTKLSASDSSPSSCDLSQYIPLIQSASTKHPSLLSSNAIIARVTDAGSRFDENHATVWLSESSMLSAALLPGSLVSVALAASWGELAEGFPLVSLIVECCKSFEISTMNGVVDKVGGFFALARALASSKVLNNNVKLSWGLSCTMGNPAVGRVVFISHVNREIKNDLFKRCSSLPNYIHESVSALPVYPCEELFLELVPSKMKLSSRNMNMPAEASSKDFGNGHIPSLKMPGSGQSRLKRFNEPFSLEGCVVTSDISAVKMVLEDKETKELLQLSSSWWLSSRVLLKGNFVTVPLCGQSFVSLVCKAVISTAEDLRRDLVHENNLAMTGCDNAAFFVSPKTKIHLVSSPPESLKKAGSSYADKTIARVSKLGGLFKEFSELKEIIIGKIHYNANYTGVLLHGPPGTGKTSMILSCAYETGVKLFHVNGPDVITYNCGRREQTLSNVFEEAKKNSPSVVFIDELDAFVPARKGGGSSGSHRMVATLLNLMDEFKTCRLLVVAATNCIDNIDFDLRRPGKFDREIEFGVPSRDQRLSILSTILSRMKHSLTELEIHHLALTTYGFVGADLTFLCNEAALTSLRRYIKLGRLHSCSDIAASGSSADCMSCLLSNSKLMPDNTSSLGCGMCPGNASDSIHVDDVNTNEVCCEKEDPLLMVTLDDFETAKNKVRPSAMREIMIEVPTVSWDDIGGQEEVKKQLSEAVDWPQKHHEAFERVGIRPPAGVLLFGPPGCSKTLMARAVASNACLNFLSVRGPELYSKWVGESEKAVRSLFAKARTAAPSVIFFDEIDGLAITRGEENDGVSVGDRVMSQLLVELDGLHKRVDVIVIAATNRPDKIDPALLRPGRFDRLLYVGSPSEADREAIFHIQLRGMPCYSDVSFKELAHLTGGCTGADISSICREAALVALEDSLEASKISTVHFKIAIDRVLPTEVQPYEDFSAKFQRLVLNSK